MRDVVVVVLVVTLEDEGSVEGWNEMLRGDFRLGDG